MRQDENFMFGRRKGYLIDGTTWIEHTHDARFREDPIYGLNFWLNVFVKTGLLYVSQPGSG
ncbi:hypothetical protein HanXRQr2_Chr07g0284621 [Helianthus annuus]|uniref:Uncharacterized protein n=2 Tax=Helianthus annuus TaxID=4232 RepID=A0A9K3IIU1_HELAN|nr:hypothetical protein HanXRQr2_Chr07g0284621 [Helianthus annuus]KAJ0903909.1 hypothetical protein HanPSC8_Chr07g0275521 [Helianthus annuus]